MEFDKNYFEAEVREGFYVTSDIKHAWAAQLEVLSDVDKACRENGIQYFAEWGTLLGAIRHHGFIPWDDDMDICMRRPDYNRYLKVAKDIMPEGYEIFDMNTDADNDNAIARIINGRNINCDGIHLEKFHGFPYVAGIDIFPLDYIAAIRDIYVPLYKGCSSVIIPKEYFMEPNRLFGYMNEHKVTSVGWSVSAFTVALSLGAFEEVKLNTLKKICFSGSVMPASCLSVWQQNLPDAKFVNQYGPTEATASCTYYEVDHLVSQDEQLPIGRPYNNYRVFLLNEDLTETPNGEIGEICVSGPILALGYYNDPERTEKSFIINPNYKGYPERMYRTGDYGRIREDGFLEFHGRMDRQVKHMGHRVELDEIEYAANQIAGVDECVSLYNKEKEVLYLFYSGETAMRQVVLELRKVLPGFMVPRKVKQVSALPKLASGKIDMTTLKEEM